MRIQVRYRKSLKMTPGKLASQCFHLAVQMGVTDKECDVIVLCVGDDSFNRMIECNDSIEVFHDAGKTEVEEGCATVLGWVDK